MNPPQPKVVITDWTFPDLGVEEAILKAHGIRERSVLWSL